MYAVRCVVLRGPPGARLAVSTLIVRIARQPLFLIGTRSRPHLNVVAEESFLFLITRRRTQRAGSHAIHCHYCHVRCSLQGCLDMQRRLVL